MTSGAKATGVKIESKEINVYLIDRPSNLYSTLFVFPRFAGGQNRS
jgi:hypothetical protein